MTSGSVQRYIPIELNQLLDKFHVEYCERFSMGNPGAITKVFTDRLFAHMYSKLVFETLGKGRITIKPQSKSKMKNLEINYDFNL